MTLTYKVEADDYLTFQLYTASRSPLVRRKRMRSRWIIPVLYVIISIPAFTNDRPLAGILLIAFSILWYAFYPYFEAKRYVRYFKAHIAEHYKDRFGEKTTVQLDNEYLVTNDGTNELKLSMADLQEVNEIDNYIFARFKSGTSLILPKHELPNWKNVAAELKTIATARNVNYNEELNWKWQ